MWSRAQLKGRAKATFKRNYWKCILISLLLTLIQVEAELLRATSAVQPVPYMDRCSWQAVPMIMTAVMSVMMVHYAILRLGLKKALRTD